MSQYAVSSGVSGMWLTAGPVGGFIWNSNPAKMLRFDSAEAAETYAKQVLISIEESRWEIVELPEPELKLTVVDDLPVELVRITPDQAAAFDSGYAAGLEAAAKLCDDRAAAHDVALGGYGKEGARWNTIADYACEATGCAAAIRSLVVSAAGARGG